MKRNHIHFAQGLAGGSGVISGMSLNRFSELWLTSPHRYAKLFCDFDLRGCRKSTVCWTPVCLIIQRCCLNARRRARFFDARVLPEGHRQGWKRDTHRPSSSRISIVTLLDLHLLSMRATLNIFTWNLAHFYNLYMTGIYKQYINRVASLQFLPIPASCFSGELESPQTWPCCGQTYVSSTDLV